MRAVNREKQKKDEHKLTKISEFRENYAIKVTQSETQRKEQENDVNYMRRKIRKIIEKCRNMRSSDETYLVESETDRD